MAEPTLEWTRSSRCADNACVEVAADGRERVAVRDSKNPEQPYLTFDRRDWNEFLDQIGGDGPVSMS
jgi:hypothetical protein